MAVFAYNSQAFSLDYRGLPSLLNIPSITSLRENGPELESLLRDHVPDASPGFVKPLSSRHGRSHTKMPSCYCCSLSF